jgi:hypothetical protein
VAIDLSPRLDHGEPDARLFPGRAPLFRPPARLGKWGISHARTRQPMPHRSLAHPATVTAYTLGMAARAVGRAKSTLSKDIKRGKISATRNPDGSVTIDASELFRVYPALVTGNTQSPVARTVGANDSPPVAGPPDNRVGLELLRERVAEQAAIIADLQRRLDASEDERRRVQERLTGLLTHRQPGSVPATVSSVYRPWWRRSFQW